MADVRALLRQQRAARRIEHPHAAYTDAGKLVCALCREHIKTEALWDGHIRSTGHRQRLQALQQQQQQQSEAQGEPNENKRKYDTQEEDDATSPVSTDETDRASKRTRPNTLSPEPGPAPPTSEPADATKPPTLTRQQSFTPTAGIELAIPSRPATPADATTTPKSAGGPLRPFSQLSEQQQQSQPPTSQPTPTFAPPTTSEPTPAPADIPQVDDDLWASFEADLLAPPKPPAVAALAEGDAVISAAPVSAAEAAAPKSHDEEQSRRRTAKDIEIEDEREEATRALETEFEVMEELEARARRLRERREALRAGKLGGQGGGAAEAGAGEEVAGTTATPVGGEQVVQGVGKTSTATAVLAVLGKENATSGNAAKGKAVEEDEDDDEEEEEDDDWDGFRFRA